VICDVSTSPQKSILLSLPLSREAGEGLGFFVLKNKQNFPHFHVREAILENGKNHLPVGRLTRRGFHTFFFLLGKGRKKVRSEKRRKTSTAGTLFLRKSAPQEAAPYKQSAKFV
jgi:hypothetical protein